MQSTGLGPPASDVGLQLYHSGRGAGVPDLSPALPQQQACLCPTSQGPPGTQMSHEDWNPGPCGRASVQHQRPRQLFRSGGEELKHNHLPLPKGRGRAAKEGLPLMKQNSPCINIQPTSGSTTPFRGWWAYKAPQETLGSLGWAPPGVALLPVWPGASTGHSEGRAFYEKAVRGTMALRPQHFSSEEPAEHGQGGGRASCNSLSLRVRSLLWAGTSLGSGSALASCGSRLSHRREAGKRG